MYLYFKRIIDVILSFIGLLALSPVFIVIIIAIKIDSKGSILFRQKRIGIYKRTFYIMKFRTMKKETPKDCPTHLLNEPDRYITRVGKILRKTSLDELPQLLNILIGDMSIVGPRPALWNQYDLIKERDKYGANSILPGLTGWAQINGRDELDINTKAKLDGYYAKHRSLAMDLYCIFNTIFSVLKAEGILEGNNKEVKKYIKDNKIKRKSINEKNILITGENSYVGESTKKWLLKTHNGYMVHTLNMHTDNWKKYDFSEYDVIFHVAGIAHVDTGKMNERQKKEYYKINTKLAVETAKKAKNEGVKQFIFMSSILVYGNNSVVNKSNTITRTTNPKPNNIYGHSKWLAEKKIQELEDNEFIVTILRSPMVYGRESKGNFQSLVKIAKKSFLFPNIQNERSIIYIDNLCRFIELVIANEDSGIFFPQNKDYSSTTEMVRTISLAQGRSIWICNIFNTIIEILGKTPTRTGVLINKAFGSLTYEKEMSIYSKGEYQLTNFKDSIRKSV